MAAEMQHTEGTGGPMAPYPWISVYRRRRLSTPVDGWWTFRAETPPVRVDAHVLSHYIMKVIFTCVFFAVCLFGQHAQGPLTDQRICDLVAAGVSAPEILRIIASAPAVDFDLRPGSTAAIMNAGVSEEMIKAMAARENGGTVIPTALKTGDSRIPAPDTGTSIQPWQPGASTIAEVGVYRRENGQWIEMMPEMVNWRSGGVVKTISTAGIVKPDRNARLRNGRSKTRLRTPVQLLVYAPEGRQITEYQLIKLRTHSNAREFRVVTGGIFHVHGDSDRDDLPFDSQHIAIRTWTITLSGLKAGEYGLLPPGLAEAQSASAQFGKMYTFTVVE
jgi:hypothetical protein